MAIPPTGTYRLSNVAFPDQMFDLNGGNIAPGTPVIGFTNNTDSQNMLWTMQVVDLANNLVRLINVASGTFAQAIIPEPGQGIVGDSNPALFMIAPRVNVGEFAIQTVDGLRACSLANPNNFTQVTLQDADGGDPRQGWIFGPP